MGIQTLPLSFGLGLIVTDIDLSSTPSDEEIKEIHEAFLKSNGLLLFRNQSLTRTQHIALSRRFGDLDTHDAVPLDRHPEHPELLMVSNAARTEDGRSGNGRSIGQRWHSDLAPSLRPALGSLLRAVEIPPVGGDTMFANMYSAYDELSEGMKAMIADLHGVHHRERKNVTKEWLEENRRLNPPVAQPVVRVHPETGRKALYIGEAVRAFEGFTEEESRPLIDFLVRHATQPRFVYRHCWRKDDLLMWDNRCTMHLALGDYDMRHRRHMERTTIIGEPSGHICEA